MPTPKLHPEYPFVKIGTVRELHPDELLFSPDEWMLQVVDVGDGGDPVELFGYFTEQAAVAAVDKLLFSSNRTWLLNYHLQRAWDNRDFGLTVKLAEGRGRVAALNLAQGEMATVKARVLAALG
jgi:hypothetical protein